MKTESIKYKTLKVIYDDTMNYDCGCGGLRIYVPTEKGYVNYNFVHTSSLQYNNADIWRLSVVNLLDNEGGFVNQITRAGAEWEMAVRINNRKDFIGGFAHGDEKFTMLTTYVDGKATDIYSINSYINFNELKIVVDSIGYDPNDGITKVLEHHKEYAFTEKGVTLDQTIIWADDYSLQPSSYLAMMPPLKYSVTDSECIISDSFYTDIDKTAISLANSLSLSKENVSSVCVFGSKSGMYFNMSKRNISPIFKSGNTMLLNDNGGLNYNKMYFVFAGSDCVKKGDIWKATTEYNIDWR